MVPHQEAGLAGVFPFPRLFLAPIQDSIQLLAVTASPCQSPRWLQAPGDRMRRLFFLIWGLGSWLCLFSSGLLSTHPLPMV